MALYMHKFFPLFDQLYGAGNAMLGLLSLFSSVLLQTSFAASNIMCQVRFFPNNLAAGCFKTPSAHLIALLQILPGMQ